MAEFYASLPPLQRRTRLSARRGAGRARPGTGGRRRTRELGAGTQENQERSRE